MVGMIRKKIFFWLCIFLLFNLLGFFIFIVILIFGLFGISFIDWDLVSIIYFIGFENYKRLFNDLEFWKLFRNIIMFIIGYLFSVMIFGLVCVLMLN